ncbi:MAG: UbiD family decarboxylase domain-containing protein, partial [Sciscionella sp.]
MGKDLRSFLTELAQQAPGDLLRIDDPVDRRFGITAFGAAAARHGDRPAFLFANVAGSGLPCVANLLATRERMALALGCSTEDLARASSTFDGRVGHAPLQVDARDAPVTQVVQYGDDVDLGELPVPVHNELDGGPFLTAAMTVMRDPDSGRLNVGLYRHHVYDERHLGVWFFGSHHGGTIHRRYAERGEPTPVAIVIGHHPAMLMGAVSRIPGIGGEYEAAGAYLGEPVEVVTARTSDLLVPARAEIVLEGVILPGEMREEGPFAEWPGHYIAGGPKPLIRIDAITMRSGAIF